MSSLARLWNKGPYRCHRAAACVAAATGLWLGTPPQRVTAQEPERAQVDSLQRELTRVLARLDSLEAVLAAWTPAQAPEPEDPLARLRAQAAAAAAAARGDTVPDPTEEEDQEFEGRQRALQALNPEISVNADVFGQIDGESPDKENFFPREFELSFQAALDPFSRAKLFIGRHFVGGEIVPFDDLAQGEEEGGHGHGDSFGVEEGYLQWVGLPGGVGLKVGKFYQQFGNLNRWHSHALPFQSRPLSHLVFIGEEPLSQSGASLYWLAPTEGAGTYEATLEVTSSGNETLFGDSRRPSYLAHLNAFWDLSTATYFELGVSAITGTHETEEGTADRWLYGLEGAFSWRPPARALYRELSLRGGLMIMDGGSTVGDSSRERATGWWTWGELRFARQWTAGARYEWVQNPEEDSETAWLFAPVLTWWQSEWVRLRLEHDVLGRPDARTWKLLLQVTFAMGPHKHETY